jgi:hypothetical protein
MAIGGCLLATLPAAAQTPENLNQELILVRPYEPSVTDAQKITVLPNLRDTASVKPTFNYTIQSKRINTHPVITPINAAKLQALPQQKLYRGYLKAGIGTTLHPMLDVALNSLRNDKYMGGVMAHYDGMFDDVKLANDKKVYAGYTDVGGKLFGQRFFRNSYLYADASGGRKTIHNYGYKPDVDTLIAKERNKQSYNFADGRIGVKSSQFNTTQLNFDVLAAYRYTGNKTDMPTLGGGSLWDFASPLAERKFREHDIALNAELDNNMFGGNLDFQYYKRSAAFDSLQNNFSMQFNPWFVLDNDSLRLEVGMRVAVYKEGKNGILQYKVYPKVEFQFTLFKDVFIPIVGLDGELKTCTYLDLIEENPFVRPGTMATAANTKFNIYAGLKGSITSKLSYYLKANFQNSDNEHFFVNDTTYSKTAQNFFTVVTDNISLFRVGGELYYNPNERLELRLKATYNRYEMLDEKFAWHRPAWETEFSAKYEYRRLLLGFDMYTVGKRYAKSFDPAVEYYTLKSAFDCNISAEYRLAKWFSVFAKLNNILGQNYESWNFYPSRRFNMMAGITLSL